MNTIDLASGQGITDMVTAINGSALQTPVTLQHLLENDNRFSYNIDSNGDVYQSGPSITSLDLLDATSNPYTPTFNFFIGGRPADPPRPHK